MSRLRAAFHASLLVACVACSGTPGPSDPSDGPSFEPRPRRDSSAPRITAEVGALDEQAVQQVFSGARAEVDACLEKANAKMRYKIIGGDVEVEVRVKSDGSVRWAFPTHSTLGHAATERCILSVLERQTWPRPEGGEEGIARTSYGIDPPGREPVDWNSSDLGEAGSELTAKLRACERQTGSGGLTVTLYVDREGGVLSVGAAVGDENGIDALGCAIEAATGMHFPSPGSYPAKVSVGADG